MFQISDAEQQAIVHQCQQFKQAVIAHARPKKEMMRRCYAYLKSQFYGDDLLPMPATLGAERDQSQHRPQVFIPIAREQFKLLYAYLKLILFPNDQDYFRIRAKTADGARYEDALTEGMKHLFRASQVTEKMGQFLMDLVWSGNGVACPVLKRTPTWSWSVDLETQQAIPTQEWGEPTLDIEVWDPLSFYIDPQASDPERARWGYFSHRKLSEVQDDPALMNREHLAGLAQGSRTSRDVGTQGLDAFNHLSAGFQDPEPSVGFDHYYFPYLKTPEREYRNILITVAGNRVLVAFRPNFTPRGQNPVVFCTWMPDKDSPYGTGPLEDIQDLQRLINILYNHQIETFARIGNRFIVREGVDLSQFWGVAGGIALAPDPQSDIVPIHGDYVETAHLANLIGTLRAEAEVVAGSQNPFQGSSAIDFKKTATEIQLLQENSISVLREIVDHVSVMGVQRILDRLMRLVAELFPTPVTLRRGQGGQDFSVDFSVLKSGAFTLELVGMNPSQSKQAQVSGLMQFVELMAQNPELLFTAEPILRQIGMLWGIKNTQDLLAEVQQRLRDAHAPVSGAPPHPAG